MKDGDLILNLGQQIIDLKAERAKLREALEPFALMGVQLEYEETKGEGKWLGHEQHWIDCIEFNPCPTVSDLRRARNVLDETK
jgi:hypothetical protein